MSLRENWVDELPTGAVTAGPRIIILENYDNKPPMYTLLNNGPDDVPARV